MARLAVAGTAPAHGTLPVVWQGDHVPAARRDRSRALRSARERHTRNRAASARRARDPRPDARAGGTGGLHPLAARDRLRQAWVAFLEELVAEQPAVVLVEDLHWADEALSTFSKRGWKTSVVRCSYLRPRGPSSFAVGRPGGGCARSRRRHALAGGALAVGRRPDDRRADSCRLAGACSRCRGRPSRGKSVLRRRARPDADRPGSCSSARRQLDRARAPATSLFPTRCRRSSPRGSTCSPRRQGGASGGRGHRPHVLVRPGLRARWTVRAGLSRARGARLHPPPLRLVDRRASASS